MKTLTELKQDLEKLQKVGMYVLFVCSFLSLVIAIFTLSCAKHQTCIVFDSASNSYARRATVKLNPYSDSSEDLHWHKALNIDNNMKVRFKITGGELSLCQSKIANKQPAEIYSSIPFTIDPSKNEFSNAVTKEFEMFHGDKFELDVAPAQYSPYNTYVDEKNVEQRLKVSDVGGRKTCSQQYCKFDFNLLSKRLVVPQHCKDHGYCECDQPNGCKRNDHCNAGVEYQYVHCRGDRDHNSHCHSKDSGFNHGWDVVFECKYCKTKDFIPSENIPTEGTACDRRIKDNYTKEDILKDCNTKLCFWFGIGDKYIGTDSGITLKLKDQTTEDRFALNTRLYGYHDRSTNLLYKSDQIDLANPEKGSAKFLVELEHFPNISPDGMKKSSGYGAYNFTLRHYPCYRSKGIGKQDANSNINRGEILYRTCHPNTARRMNLCTEHKALQFYNGNAYIEIQQDQDGELELAINNIPKDQRNSSGFYNIDVLATTHQQEEFENHLPDGIMYLRNLTINVGKKIFQGIVNNDSFKNYTTVLLIIYIIMYGMFFIMGMVEHTPIELLIRLFKLCVVGLLFSGKTYSILVEPMWEGIDGLMNALMSSIASATIDTQHAEIGVIQWYVNSIKGVIAADNGSYWVRIFALLNVGISGLAFPTIQMNQTPVAAIMLVIMILASLIMFTISLAQIMVVYIISGAYLGVLIGMSPIFFTLLLFSRTKSLFDNWCRYVLRNMCEPVIAFLGIAILNKLYQIYIMQVLNFSVCYKPAVPIRLPILGQFIASLAGVANQPLFAFPMLVPWGYDMQGYNIFMHDIAALYIIGFCMYNYVSVADSLCTSVFGYVGASGVGTTAAIQPSSGNIYSAAAASYRKLTSPGQVGQGFVGGLGQMWSELKNIGGYVKSRPAAIKNSLANTRDSAREMFGLQSKKPKDYLNASEYEREEEIMQGEIVPIVRDQQNQQQVPQVQQQAQQQQNVVQQGGGQQQNGGQQQAQQQNQQNQQQGGGQQ